MKKNILAIFLIAIVLFSTGCLALSGQEDPTSIPSSSTPESSNTATPLPPSPFEHDQRNANEPVLLKGSIPYTSPFFLETVSEAFVLLEDQSGFSQRNLEYEFPLSSQMIGPVEIDAEDQLTFQLNLPSIPTGTSIDVDNDGQTDLGVQVFAVAYWSNTWGGPFLEKRDGTGWSNAYASTITDPDLDFEITGGSLIVWAPDGKQAFPIGFGDDGKLFTDDDPTTPIDPGYSLVSLDQEPFEFSKEQVIELDLYEGVLEVNDYSDMSYVEAFEQLYNKASVEYPFTNDKELDWQELYDQYLPQIEDASNASEFFIALHDFSLSIPDGHIGISFTDTVSQIFFEMHGGSFGMVLAELSDGSIIVKDILPDTPADNADIVPGTQILSWNGVPVSEAIENTESFFGPYSTSHLERLEKIIFLTRVPVDEEVEISFANPGESVESKVTLTSVIEYDSLFAAIPSFNVDELALPVESTVFEDLNLGYIQITTFSDDYNLSAQLWDRYINELLDYEVDGLILDIRVNGGGNSGLASDFVGYFFDETKEISKRSYYNHITGEFDYKEPISKVEPGPIYFDKPMTVLVSPYCVSACEGFANMLSIRDDTYIVGHYPTAGAYGEVGRGQYDLPDEFSMQFPTGRSETINGELLIEGEGVVPDVLVPVTLESVLGELDTVLLAAFDLLLE